MFGYLYVVLAFVGSTTSSTCGSSGIPFRLEVLPNGQLVLGCASPSCFGADYGGRSIVYDSKFEEEEEGDDGFFREGDLQKPKSRYRSAPPELAECPQTHSFDSCPASDSWVGGIKKEAGGKIKVQCCVYNGLRFATEMGKVVIHRGEVFSGGEVIRDGRQTGFDLISSIKQLENSDNGKSSYEVTIMRLSCIPDPPETTNYVVVDLDAQADIGRILDKVKDGDEVSGTKTDQVVYQASDNSLWKTVYDHNVPVEEQISDLQHEKIVQQPMDVIEEQHLTVQHPMIAPAPPAYYPVVGYRRRCFASSTLVTTSRGLITMQQLQIGDYVLTKEGNSVRYTTVKSFLHRLPNQKTDFLWLKLSDGNSLKLTPYHFIYRTNCNGKRSVTQMVYAKDLEEGDCLFTIDVNYGQSTAYLLFKKMITENGAYAPLTESGDIIANNIYVSCHGHVRPSTLTHTFMSWMQKIHHWLFGDILEPKIDLPSAAHFFLDILEHIIPHS